MDPRKVALALLLFSAHAQTPPAEGMRERTNMRNQRYCEILLVKGSLFSPKAEVYNTIGLNECPPEKWAALNVDAIQKQFNARRVVLNGPRHFLMDRNALKAPGKVENFQGLEARLLALHRKRRRTRNPLRLRSRRTSMNSSPPKASFTSCRPTRRRSTRTSMKRRCSPSAAV